MKVCEMIGTLWKVMKEKEVKESDKIWLKLINKWSKMIDRCVKW